MFYPDVIQMSWNVSKTKRMYISSRHKQQTLANCDYDISICESKIQVSSVEKLLGVTISNTLYSLLGCSYWAAY